MEKCSWENQILCFLIVKYAGILWTTPASSDSLFDLLITSETYTMLKCCVRSRTAFFSSIFNINIFLAFSTSLLRRFHMTKTGPGGSTWHAFFRKSFALGNLWRLQISPSLTFWNTRACLLSPVSGGHRESWHLSSSLFTICLGVFQQRREGCSIKTTAS